MFSLFELVWKRIRLFFTDDEVFYIGGADVLHHLWSGNRRTAVLLL